MPLPLSPADFEALIPDFSGDKCTEARKALVQFPTAWVAIYKYMFQEDTATGEVSLTNDFGQDICDKLQEIGCTVTGGGGTSTSSTSSTTTGGGGGLPPSNITSIEATQGFSSNLVSVVWVKPINATKYDIYRGATSNFNLATLIDEDVVPADAATETVFPPIPSGNELWDNGVEMVYLDNTGVPITQYYYFVVPKNASLSGNPTAGALGWCGNSPGFLNGSDLIPGAGTVTIPTGFTQVRILAVSRGGGGAGGSLNQAGGGGGGGIVVLAEYVTDGLEGNQIQCTLTPGSVALQTDPETDGEDGGIVTIAINGDPIIQFEGGYAGLAGGAPGAGGNNPPTFYSGANQRYWVGRSGLGAVGLTGGASGYYFGAKRTVPANFNTIPGGWTGIPSAGSYGTSNAGLVQFLLGGGVSENSSYVYIQYGI